MKNYNVLNLLCLGVSLFAAGHASAVSVTVQNEAFDWKEFRICAHVYPEGNITARQITDLRRAVFAEREKLDKETDKEGLLAGPFVNPGDSDRGLPQVGLESLKRLDLLDDDGINDAVELCIAQQFNYN